MGLASLLLWSFITLRPSYLLQVPEKTPMWLFIWAYLRRNDALLHKKTNLTTLSVWFKIFEEEGKGSTSVTISLTIREVNGKILSDSPGFWTRLRTATLANNVVHISSNPSQEKNSNICGWPFAALSPDLSLACQLCQHLYRLVLNDFCG